MRSDGWALIHYDWRPYTKRLRDTHTYCEDTEGSCKSRVEESKPANSEEINLLFKQPSLWCFVTAALENKYIVQGIFSFFGSDSIWEIYALGGHQGRSDGHPQNVQVRAMVSVRVEILNTYSKI